MASLPAIRQDFAIAPIEGLMQQADIYVKSGLAPARMTKEQIVVVMLKGREMGIPPMMAIEHMYTVKNKTGMDGQLIGAQLRRYGHSFWVVESDAQHCVMMFQRRGEKETHRVEMTMAEIQKAGWDMEDEKDDRGNKTGNRKRKYTYTSMPATMVQYRCLSKGAKLYGGDAMNGLPPLVDLEGGEEIEAAAVSGDEYVAVQTHDGLDVQRRESIARDHSFMTQPGTRGRGKMFKATATPAAQRAPEPTDGQFRESKPEELQQPVDEDAEAMGVPPKEALQPTEEAKPEPAPEDPAPAGPHWTAIADEVKGFYAFLKAHGLTKEDAKTILAGYMMYKEPLKQLADWPHDRQRAEHVTMAWLIANRPHADRATHWMEAQPKAKAFFWAEMGNHGKTAEMVHEFIPSMHAFPGDVDEAIEFILSARPEDRGQLRMEGVE